MQMIMTYNFMQSIIGNACRQKRQKWLNKHGYQHFALWRDKIRDMALIEYKPGRRRIDCKTRNGYVSGEGWHFAALTLKVIQELKIL